MVAEARPGPKALRRPAPAEGARQRRPRFFWAFLDVIAMTSLQEAFDLLHGDGDLLLGLLDLDLAW